MLTLEDAAGYICRITSIGGANISYGVKGPREDKVIGYDALAFEECLCLFFTLC